MDNDKEIKEGKVIIRLLDGSTVKGKVNIIAEGTFFERISDIFAVGRNPFVVVFDATIEAKAEKVMIINKNSISWVIPEN